MKDATKKLKMLFLNKHYATKSGIMLVKIEYEQSKYDYG